MRNTKKILVPLATLLAAGAIAVGSGATFTSTQGNTISAATAGSLKIVNDKNGAAAFNFTDIKPGDSRNATLTLKNTGTLPATLKLTEKDAANGFTGANLKLVITDVEDAKTVYTGTFGGFQAKGPADLGQIAPDETNTYKFVVSLDTNTDNNDQGKTASAAYTWDATQLNGEIQN